MKEEKIVRSPAIYKILKPPAVFLFRLFFRTKISGKENIPKKGAVVLAGNHIKFWDCFMVMAGTNRAVHFLAKSELFGNFFTKWFFNAAGLIPVHRNRKDHNALASAERYLEEGSVIGVFPEGTTRKGGKKLLPFKMGAVKMASDTNTPIVPFTIKGKYGFLGTKAEIIFHKPIYINGNDLESENEHFREFIKSNLKDAGEENE